MLPPLLVSIVYGVVPIAAILLGWTLIRKDYAPQADASETIDNATGSDKEV